MAACRFVLFLAFGLFVAGSALAQQGGQGGMIQGGAVSRGHAPVAIQAQGPSANIYGDGGTALDGNFTELGITNMGTPWCITDVPRTTAGGYHQLCLGANALGGGLLSYNNYNGAAPLPFTCIIDGVTHPGCLQGGSSPPPIPPFVGDGVTDNCAAITAAVAAPSPVALVFGAGTFYSTCGISTTNKSLAVSGVGKGATALLFAAGIDGISPATSSEFVVDISNLAIETQGNNANRGVNVTYTAAGFANRDVTKLNVTNVLIKGATQATQSWNACLSLTEVYSVRISNLDCIGNNGPSGTTSNAQATNTTTTYGIFIAGTHSPSDVKMTDSKIQSVNNGIYAVNTNMEGLQLTTNTFLFVNNPVYWVTGSAAQGSPFLLATGNNFDAYSSCITLTGVSESFISKNLFYHDPGATSDQICVNISGANSISIEDNEFENFVAGATPHTTGVQIGPAAGYSLPASFEIRISNNLFGVDSSFYDSGIILLAGTAQHFLSNNQFGPNLGTGITDSTAAAAGQQTAPGRYYIFVKLSAAQTIADSTPTLITWDTVQYQTLGWTFTAPSTGVAVGPSRFFTSARCTGQIEFNVNATGLRIAKLLDNGIAIQGLPAVAHPGAVGIATDLQLAGMAITPVIGGDTFSVQVAQNSGGPLQIDPQTTYLECEAIQ